MTGREVGTDELFLAAEVAIERCFRAVGTLDDAVDADAADAFAVEELIGCGQQPLAHGQVFRGLRGHSFDNNRPVGIPSTPSTYRPVCFKTQVRTGRATNVRDSTA